MTPAYRQAPPNICWWRLYHSQVSFLRWSHHAWLPAPASDLWTIATAHSLKSVGLAGHFKHFLVNRLSLYPPHISSFYLRLHDEQCLLHLKTPFMIWKQSCLVGKRTTLNSLRGRLSWLSMLHPNGMSTTVVDLWAFIYLDFPAALPHNTRVNIWFSRMIYNLHRALRSSGFARQIQGTGPCHSRFPMQPSETALLRIFKRFLKLNQ